MSESDHNAPSHDLAKETDSETHESQQVRLDTAEDKQSIQTSLEEKLQAEIKKSAELSKRALYLQADLMNSMRQTERRIAEAREETSVKYIDELISLKEDLERALNVTSESEGASSLSEGLEMLLSKLDSFLESDDVRRIDVQPDSQMDTRFHEAVAFSDVPDRTDGTILSVIRNGYTYKGKVIKTALVEVARPRNVVGRQEEISVNNSSEKSEVSS